MTAICRKCGIEVQQRFVGSIMVWGHVSNPKQYHHPVMVKIEAKK